MKIYKSNIMRSIMMILVLLGSTFSSDLHAQIQVNINSPMDFHGGVASIGERVTLSSTYNIRAVQFFMGINADYRTGEEIFVIKEDNLIILTELGITVTGNATRNLQLLSATDLTAQEYNEVLKYVEYHNLSITLARKVRNITIRAADPSRRIYQGVLALNMTNGEHKYDLELKVITDRIPIERRLDVSTDIAIDKGNMEYLNGSIIFLDNPTNAERLTLNGLWNGALFKNRIKVRYATNSTIYLQGIAKIEDYQEILSKINYNNIDPNFKRNGRKERTREIKIMTSGTLSLDEGNRRSFYESIESGTINHFDAEKAARNRFLITIKRKPTDLDPTPGHGYLATLVTPKENDIVVQYSKITKKGGWIGAYTTDLTKSKGGKWTWIPGSPEAGVTFDKNSPAWKNWYVNTRDPRYNRRDYPNAEAGSVAMPDDYNQNANHQGAWMIPLGGDPHGSGWGGDQVGSWDDKYRGNQLNSYYAEYHQGISPNQKSPWTGTIYLVDETYTVSVDEVDKTIAHCDNDADFTLSILKEGNPVTTTELTDLTILWENEDGNGIITGDIDKRAVNVKLNADANQATFFYTVTDNVSGDKVSDKIAVTVTKAVKPTITFTESTFNRRIGDEIPINISTTIAGTKADKNGYTFADLTWTKNSSAGTETNFDTNDRLTPSIVNPFVKGIHTYTATLKDGSCDVSENVIINVKDEIKVIATDIEVGYCTTPDSLITVSLGTQYKKDGAALSAADEASLEYSWTVAQAEGRITSNFSGKSITVNIFGESAIFTCTIKDTFTSTEERHSITVTRLPQVVLTTNKTTYVINEGYEIADIIPPFTIGTLDARIDASTIEWTSTDDAGFVGINGSLTATPSTDLMEGTYIYTAKAKDDKGCETTLEFIFKVVNMDEEIINVSECDLDAEKYTYTLDLATKYVGENYTFDAWGTPDKGAISNVVSTATTSTVLVEFDETFEKARLPFTIKDVVTNSILNDTITIKLAKSKFATVGDTTILLNKDTGIGTEFTVKDNLGTVTWEGDVANPLFTVNADDLSIAIATDYADLGKYIYTATDTYKYKSNEKLTATDKECVVTKDFKVIVVEIQEKEVSIGECKDEFELTITKPLDNGTPTLVTLQTSTLYDAVMISKTATEITYTVSNIDASLTEFLYDVKLANEAGFDDLDMLTGKVTLKKIDKPTITQVQPVGTNEIFKLKGEGDLTDVFEISHDIIGTATIIWKEGDDVVSNTATFQPAGDVSKTYTVFATNEYGCNSDTLTFTYVVDELMLIDDNFYVVYQDEVDVKLSIRANDRIPARAVLTLDATQTWTNGEAVLDAGEIKFTPKATPALVSSVIQTFEYGVDLDPTKKATVTVLILPRTREVSLPSCQADTAVIVTDNPAITVNWTVINGNIREDAGKKYLAEGEYTYTFDALDDASRVKSSKVIVTKLPEPMINVQAFDDKDKVVKLTNNNMIELRKYETNPYKIGVSGTAVSYTYSQIIKGEATEKVDVTAKFDLNPTTIKTQKDSLFTYEFVGVDANKCEVKSTLYIERYNTAPEINGTTINVLGTTPTTVTVEGISDEDEIESNLDIDEKSYKVVNNDDLLYGTATFDKNGDFTYTPSGNRDFTESVVIEICDYSNECITATIDVVGTLDGVIPELITPNGDGIHDFFIVPGFKPAEQVHLIIMNRWGNKVYESENYNDEWFGQSNVSSSFSGKTLPVGTYFYIIKVDGHDDIKGNVHVTN